MTMKITLTIPTEEMEAALATVAAQASKALGKEYNEADIALVAIDFWMKHRTTGSEDVPDEGWSVRIEDLPEHLRPSI